VLLESSQAYEVGRAVSGQLTLHFRARARVGNDIDGPGGDAIRRRRGGIVQPLSGQHAGACRDFIGDGLGQGARRHDDGVEARRAGGATVDGDEEAARFRAHPHLNLQDRRLGHGAATRESEALMEPDIIILSAWRGRAEFGRSKRQGR
jgi:hypothetical protein